MESIKTWIAQGNLRALIEKTNQTHQPMLIYSAQGSSVLVGEAEWREMQEKIRKHAYPKSVDKTPTQFEAKDPHQMEWQQTRDDGYFSDA